MHFCICFLENLTLFFQFFVIDHHEKRRGALIRGRALIRDNTVMKGKAGRGMEGKAWYDKWQMRGFNESITHKWHECQQRYPSVRDIGAHADTNITRVIAVISYGR